MGITQLNETEIYEIQNLTQQLVNTSYSSYGGQPMYETYWMILPGMYKLPWITNGTFQAQVTIDCTYLAEQPKNRHFDNFYGGNFFFGNFQGKWYDSSGKTNWKDGNWNNAWNDVLQCSIKPNTQINTSAGPTDTIYNQNLDNLKLSGRYLDNPPWVNKEKQIQNVVTPPLKNNTTL